MSIQGERYDGKVKEQTKITQFMVHRRSSENKEEEYVNTKKNMFIPYLYKTLENKPLCNVDSEFIHYKINHYKSKIKGSDYDHYTHVSSISFLYNEPSKYVDIEGIVERVGYISMNNTLYKAIELVDDHARILVVMGYGMFDLLDTWSSLGKPLGIRVMGMVFTDKQYLGDGICIMAHNIQCLPGLHNKPLSIVLHSLSSIRITSPMTFQDEYIFFKQTG